ncbi:NACHT and WD40 domain protein [Aspergillus neoniger CBS 115656]|uniref:NACHT and WD40 domain protein n=1 Tax=Aspergillus neoniger (strain CBS 115656) TaxID=1448310 RepID=A0A318Y341_ASPNB|nr:NACHT and WD40 domain protein [Aspergillus neoniger CBS 115656]PYH28219.1 NACHT and WD40 domain protein [Aspergillus neoniger CBS 115656]
MAKHLRKCFCCLFYQDTEHEKPATQAAPEENQKGHTANAAQTIPLDTAYLSTEPEHALQPRKPRNLWQAAYNQLERTQQDILLKTKVSVEPGDEDNRLPSSIDRVIKTTKEEYKKYHETADQGFHETSRKILNLALSFKDIIDAVTALDPTQHAASAWTIVSLGLTMAKSYSDLRDASFKSSVYLADILTYGAFVEKRFYRERKTNTDSRPVEEAFIRLYKAILSYTAQMQRTRQASFGEKVLNSVTRDLQQSLATLQTVAEDEKNKLTLSITFDQYLRHEQDANEILHKIDALAQSVKHVLEHFVLLNLHIAEGAFYNSFANRHMDYCLPNTRSEFFSQVSEWIKSSNKSIFWVNGMAGTGKSTIARTVARDCESQGLLGATFFFNRNERDRADARHLISTITRQLITRYPELGPAVLDVLKGTPNIASQDIQNQFEKLLYLPLTTITPDENRFTVIILDALDECNGDDDLRLILRLVSKLQGIESVQLRIFLTSRPEMPIRLGFSENKNHLDLVLHELPKPVIEHDIRVFLDYKLSEIQRERSLPLGWPGIEKRERLVQMAVPLFIFAATACRFIKEGKHPKKHLESFLESQNAGKSQMDKIYLPILQQFLGNNEDEFDNIIEDFQNIVGVIILLANPLSIQSLASLLKVKADYISEALDSLHSVLYIPGDQETPVRILHLSFREYLLTKKSVFHVDEQGTHNKIALHCLRLMKDHLKQNICKLENYGILHEDINPQMIKEHLTADLKYACRCWVHHLKQSKGLISDYDVLSFLREHILHWLEALALLGEISEAVRLISTLQSRIWKSINTELSDFLYDADRFVRQNSYMAGIAPLQLYRAGLVFAPNRSIIKKAFYSKVIGQQIQLTGVEESWSPNLQTFEGHSSSVSSVALSPDGRILASGSWDDTIKLWDPATGVEQRTLTGHSSLIFSVAFSPDGRTLASGSRDHTIKLWNPVTGVEQRTLTGHSSTVFSVAFSPDGRTLASGSDDKTIKLWDPATGVEQRTLTGHSSTVSSVAFLPDGRILASGSWDQTIKLWEPSSSGTRPRASSSAR